ncbi:hypothetical protein E3N88_29386 [Mikania micrantha]|uniref:Integrase catalytic domain-containing protein n=1 Tax=Mikania micrantha TaxID=192012 RepID=A0A5N6MJ31_9ASTR|nr:hypothetical protein E3N88_29386 [Mikania micrantha]
MPITTNKFRDEISFQRGDDVSTGKFFVLKHFCLSNTINNNQISGQNFFQQGDDVTPDNFRHEMIEKRFKTMKLGLLGLSGISGVSKLADAFIKEIIQLHGTPASIVSDRDPRFTSRFWKGFQTALGTRLKFSTAFHPQTDGQSECTIQTLEDMLRACALEWTENWDDYLCLVEFAYNNSWQASIDMAPFELLYGRKCRAPICWNEVGEKIIEGPELIQITNDKVAIAREKFGIKGKLSPRYIGPFEILERIGEVSYRLALPSQLSHVHNVFHVSLLRGYNYHSLHIISYPLHTIQEDLSYEKEPEAILDRQERIMRKKVIPFIKVLWKKSLRARGDLGN